MIFGIGVDLCEIARIENLYERYGDKFAHKLLTQAEYLQLKTKQRPAQFLASRFAAKEAAAKALGTGFRGGITLQTISIKNNELGKPELEFIGEAAIFSNQHGINNALVSISDERTHVAAFVVLEK